MRRDDDDFYQTPAWCVHRLLDRIGGFLLEPNGRPRILEPAYGRGAICRAVNGWALEHGRQVPRWMCVDIVDHRDKNDETDVSCLYRADFLEEFGSSAEAKLRLHDSVITNPPFRDALPFVQRSMECAPIVIMLLRMGWLGSEDRAQWLRDHTPAVYLLPNRPSFRGKGTSDNSYYAWMVWGLDGDESRFQILDSTPLEERRGRRPWRGTGQLEL